MSRIRLLFFAWFLTSSTHTAHSTRRVYIYIHPCCCCFTRLTWLTWLSISYLNRETWLLRPARNWKNRNKEEIKFKIKKGELITADKKKRLVRRRKESMSRHTPQESSTASITHQWAYKHTHREKERPSVVYVLPSSPFLLCVGARERSEIGSIHLLLPRLRFDCFGRRLRHITTTHHHDGITTAPPPSQRNLGGLFFPILTRNCCHPSFSPLLYGVQKRQWQSYSS